MGAWLELRGKSGALRLVRSLTCFATKLMVKIPSANQSKRAAAIIAPCLHTATTDFRPCNNDECNSFQQTSKSDDLATGFGFRAYSHPQFISLAASAFQEREVCVQAVKWIRAPSLIRSQCVGKEPEVEEAGKVIASTNPLRPVVIPVLSVVSIHG
jgi:hypothetical protein